MLELDADESALVAALQAELGLPSAAAVIREACLSLSVDVVAKQAAKR